MAIRTADTSLCPRFNGIAPTWRISQPESPVAKSPDCATDAKGRSAARQPINGGS